MPSSVFVQFPGDFENSPLYRGANFIINQLTKNNYQALWAGGAVRDILLGSVPKDIDIATNARPEEVQKIFKKTMPIGVQFGVILVLHKGIPYEVATFRGDGKYLDGRRPASVNFTDAREDALRRDFTINGMFLDPEQRTIVDYVGGQQDLKQKIIRTIGKPEDRFAEDHLRMLRALRFSLRFQFDIEKETFLAIQKNAESLKIISVERIQEELIKILSKTGTPFHEFFDLFYKSGLMAQLFPDIPALNRYHVKKKQFLAPFLSAEKEKILSKHEQPKENDLLPLFELTRNTLLHLTNLCALHKDKKITFHTPFAALLQYIGIVRQNPSESWTIKNVISGSSARSLEILKQFKFSNADIKEILDLIENQEIFRQAQDQKISTIKKWLQKMNFWNNLIFFQAKQLSLASAAHHYADLASFPFLLKKAKSFSQEEITPSPLITGNDLKEIGLRPGPIFSRILKQIEEEQLQGNLKTKEGALKYARSLIGQEE